MILSRVLFLVVLVGPRVAAQSVATADTAFFETRWAAALSLYVAHLPPDGQNLASRVRAGFAAVAVGNNDLAKRYFEAVIAAQPPNGAPGAEAGLAVVLARAGRSSEAIARLEAAAGRGYANLTLVDTTAAFRPLQSDPRYVAARRRVEQNAYPCLADSTARQFDFWIGEWNVYVTGTAIPVGSNLITRVAGGCAILETWTALAMPQGGPSGGTSLNFADPATNEWRQIWMGSAKGQNNYGKGRFKNGVMEFEYQRATPQGAAVVGRFRFFDLGPNRVRQWQEGSTDGGKTYQTVYDFTYVRKGSGEPVVTGR